MKLTNGNHIMIDGDVLAEELGYTDLMEMQVALAHMEHMKPDELDMDELSELTEIEIDETLTKEQQALSLLRQTKNPYFYRYEGMIVMISDEGRGNLNHFLSHCLYTKWGRS